MESFNAIKSEGKISSNNNSPLTPRTPPFTTTHDTSKATYHISDIAAFSESLQDAANQAFPNRGRSRYHTVNVCLIRWEEDELQVEEEVNHLRHVFEAWYGFNTEIWLIPSSCSQIRLTRQTCDFLQKCDAEDSLCIVYYGGHGKINSARQNEWWCKSGPDSPFVNWTSIQTLFSTAASDVLVLLDCCAAASSASGSGSSTMETIAACGFETVAPAPGENSFTYTLIEVLEEWVDRPSFSAAMLHTEILFILKQKRPERGMDGRRWEWCSTPIHWVCSGDPKAPGIEIASLKIANAAVKKVQEEAPPRSTTYVDFMELDDDNSQQNPLTATQPNGNYKIPHVLISIALEEDQETLDALSCRRWLLKFPALVKYATVEGVYKGFSTLITLSLPVMVWDLLPDHPACSFVGYIVSPNKIKQSLSIETELLLLRQAKLASHHYKLPRLSKLRSCDSSYGSEGSDSERGVLRNGTSESWEILSSDADDDDSEWEETFSRLSIGKTPLGECSSKPIDIRSNGLFRGQRYRSPDQEILFPKALKGPTACESFHPNDEAESERPHARLASRGDVVQRRRSKSCNVP